MPASYYLDCQCGKRLTVEPRQAGSQLTCDCGATLEVPTLRGLQSLPRAEDRPEQTAAVWTVRQAVATAGVLLALMLFSMGCWYWWQERQFQNYRAGLEDKTQLVEAMNTDVAKHLEEATPLQAWRYWEYQFKPSSSSGFADLTAGARENVDSAIRVKKIERWSWWGAAAAVLACTLLWVYCAPRKKGHSTY